MKNNKFMYLVIIGNEKKLTNFFENFHILFLTNFDNIF